MKKDVWEFYSNEKDCVVELPVRIATAEEFFQYCDTLDHEIFEDTGPRPVKASDIRRSPRKERYQAWAEECGYDFPVFAIIDDEEFADWFCTGVGKYDADGELQYDFN